MKDLLYILAIALAFIGGRQLWFLRSRRPTEPGFPFVKVNSDGTARELSPEEQQYLSEEFDGADGGRPYVKLRYEARDGWGSLSGFLGRRKLPKQITIMPFHPEFDARTAENRESPFELLEGAGRIITHNKDGSVTDSPDPKLTSDESFKLARQAHLRMLQEQEELARPDDPAPPGA